MLTKIFKEIKNILLSEFGYWVPIVFFLFFLNKIYLHYFGIVYGFISVAALFILITAFFGSRIKLTIQILLILLYNGIIYINIYHLYTFGIEINTNTIFNVFNTNNRESTEYLSSIPLFEVLSIGCFLILIIGLYIVYKILRKKNIQKSNKLTLLILVIVLLPNIFHRFHKNTFPYILADGYLYYKSYIEYIKTFTKDKYGGYFTNVCFKENNEQNQTYIFVMGESASSTHMQLYNYTRSTNPFTSKIKGELTIFKDIISPYHYSFHSLLKTFSIHSRNSKHKDGTLIQLFNKAGFSTYWISNQSMSALYDRPITLIAKNSDNHEFVNLSKVDMNEIISYDDKILLPLEKALNDKKKNKFIIIHLLGSHYEYKKRYPDNFNKFTDVPKTKFKNQNAFTLINQYDNSILYTDFILNEIIELVKKTYSSSFVLYTSDHGNETFDILNLHGRGHEFLTCTMFQIPLVLWQSKKYRKSTQKFIFDENRKYSSENLIYTLSDLAFIHFDEFDSTQSIVNKHFIPKKRIILDKYDYDSLFKTKKFYELEQLNFKHDFTKW